MIVTLCWRLVNQISCNLEIWSEKKTVSLQAMYASVIPGEYMRGSLPQMVSFPSWLGKNSTTGKTDRILQELRTHMSLSWVASAHSLDREGFSTYGFNTAVLLLLVIPYLDSIV